MSSAVLSSFYSRPNVRARRVAPPKVYVGYQAGSLNRHLTHLCRQFHYRGSIILSAKFLRVFRPWSPSFRRCYEMQQFIENLKQI